MFRLSVFRSALHSAQQPWVLAFLLIKIMKYPQFMSIQLRYPSSRNSLLISASCTKDEASRIKLRKTAKHLLSKQIWVFESYSVYNITIYTLNLLVYFVFLELFIIRCKIKYLATFYIHIDIAFEQIFLVAASIIRSFFMV